MISEARSVGSVARKPVPATVESGSGRPLSRGPSAGECCTMAASSRYPFETGMSRQDEISVPRSSSPDQAPEDSALDRALAECAQGAPRPGAQLEAEPG